MVSRNKTLFKSLLKGYNLLRLVNKITAFYWNLFDDRLILALILKNDYP